VVPAYNRAAQLPRCLASIWSQEPAPPAEVVVVDDHSSDETAAVAAEHGARVIRHPENRGAAAARNSALEATSCEWIAFLDSDDEWLPHHLAHLWELRGEHALVGGSALYRSDSSEDLFHGPVGREPFVLSSPDWLISTFNVFTASASMVRRDVALSIGGFHRWWGVEDFDLWVRVLEQHTGVCSPRVTVIYHLHEANLSSEGDRMQDGHRGVAEAHLERTGGSRAPLERFEAGTAWYSIRASLAQGEPLAALRRAPALFSDRQRVIGLAVLLWTRFRMRRRTSSLDHEGRPSVALLVRDKSARQTIAAALGNRAVRDLSGVPTLGALVSLLRRPAGQVVVGSWVAAALLRAVGAPAVSVHEFAERPAAAR
jgi:hypothetical protein